MSTTQHRRSLSEALFAAEQFREMFAGTYEIWEFAGSVRRKCADIGDLEHVVIPKFGDVAGKDLFASPTRTNLVFHRADQLVAAGSIAKHIYGNGFRWGEKYRGCDFNWLGLTAHNEIFCADADNWGPTLTIRTGSAEFSQRIVTALRRNGYRNKDGYVWRCERCPDLDGGRDRRPGEKCPKCQGTGLVPVEKVSVHTEEAYFKLAGLAYIPPEKRYA
jgi:DNA polymerase/3'-5' exonuclease PolX